MVTCSFPQCLFSFIQILWLCFSEMNFILNGTKCFHLCLVTDLLLIYFEDWRTHLMNSKATGKLGEEKHQPQIDYLVQHKPKETHFLNFPGFGHQGNTVLDRICDAFLHGARRGISLGNDQQLEFVLACAAFSFQPVMFFIIFFLV